MAGDVDYLLKVVVADMAAYDAFYLDLTQCIRCRNVTSKFSMERLKATSLLPIDTMTL
jgi:Lrp/AsnC family transcriptional regulator